MAVQTVMIPRRLPATQSEALKIAKIARSMAQAEALKAIALELIRNPVVEIVGAYIIVEYCQKRGLIPSLAGTFAETAVIGAVTIQQIAPIIPDVVKAGSETLGSLMKLIPVV